MKQINVRLDEKLIKEMKQYALDNDMSFQDVVKIALENLLKYDKNC
jgi:predicted DNA binding CopG/RHH family protein